MSKLTIQAGIALSIIGITETIKPMEGVLKKSSKLSTSMRSQKTWGDIPLMKAAAEGLDEVVTKILLEELSIVNTQDCKGNTALMKATENGHVKVTRLLLDHGARVDLQNFSSYTALRIAVHAGNATMVSLLLSCRAKVNEEASIGGDTALTEACRTGNSEIVTILLNAGADVNLADYANYSPLMIATSFGYAEVVSLLLKRGAQVDLKHGPTKMTALHMAIKRGYQNIAALLWQYGAKL